MIQFSKIWYGFMAAVIIFFFIFIAELIEPLAQTAQDNVIVTDKSSNDAKKGNGLFGSGISLADLDNIGGFLGGIAAFLTLVLTLILIFRHRPSQIQLMFLTSEDFDNFLKDGQSKESSRVEKIVWDIEQNPRASFVDKATADAYRLQQSERMDEAIQMWRDIANYAEGNDNNLAARALFSVGYLYIDEGLGEEGLPAHALVLCHWLSDGYNLLSLMRASCVVNRHLTVARC